MRCERVPPLRSYNVSISFADLGVPARMVEALAADGITEPFPVQEITLPDALAGKDLCGRAPTGSGKTLGFGIPMMVRISQAEPNRPTGLVLVPTRELAEQVQKVFVTLGRAQWRFVQAIYGGASFAPQIHSLRKGASVIVATPGRLIDIIEKGYCDLSAVEVCVIDEADRMADLGFMPDVRTILDMTPDTRQTMLWSATLDGDVKELIRDYMKDPVRHDLLEDVESAPVDHRFIVTRPSERLDSAVALIEEHGPTVVFVKTRFGVDDVSEDLNRAGVKAGALHGARSQAIRQRTLDDFKRGKIQALVATDVAARGIHVDNVSLVLHYDMPDNDKDYTHRSGRTGRAGNAGLVVAFVPPSRQQLARRMSSSVNSDVSWEHGETPVERISPAERQTGNRDRGDHERGSYERGGYRSDRGGYRNDRDRDSSRGPSRDFAATRDRAPKDPNDWSPRPRRDDAPAGRPEWTPRPRRDDGPPQRSEWSPRPRRDSDAAGAGANGWAPPRTPRQDAPLQDRVPIQSREWTPRPRRDDDRTNQRGRTDRDDRFAPARDVRRDGGNDRAPVGRSDRPRYDRPSGDRQTGNRGTGDRAGYTPRTERNEYNPRGERPTYGARGDRPTYNPRGDRPASAGDRPGYNPRSDRPSYSARTDRPGSAPSSDRPWKDRGDSRPAHATDDRPWTAGRPAARTGAARGGGYAPDRPTGSNGGARRASAPGGRNATGYPRPASPSRPKRRPGA